MRSLFWLMLAIPVVGCGITDKFNDDDDDDDDGDIGDDTGVQVDIVEPAYGSLFYTYETVLFSAVVTPRSGTEASDVEARWVSTGETFCDWQSVQIDGITTCGIAFSTPGVTSVLVEVEDEVASTASATIEVDLIAPAPPSIAIVSPAFGSHFAPGETVEIEAIVADDEDSPESLQVTLMSSIQGSISIGSSPDVGGTWIAAVASLESGEHTLTLTVLDSHGMSDSDSTMVSINGAPTAPLIEISPSPATAGQSLSAMIVEEGVDPEGDPLSYDYLWLVNGAEYAGGVTPVIASGITESGQVWEVQVTPGDPFASGEPGTASITISGSGELGR